VNNTLCGSIEYVIISSANYIGLVQEPGWFFAKLRMAAKRSLAYKSSKKRRFLTKSVFFDGKYFILWYSNLSLFQNPVDFGTALFIFSFYTAGGFYEIWRKRDGPLRRGGCLYGDGQGMWIPGGNFSPAPRREIWRN
jgi:hypothetical protein